MMLYLKLRRAIEGFKSAFRILNWFTGDNAAHFYKTGLKAAQWAKIMLLFPTTDNTNNLLKYK